MCASPRRSGCTRRCRRRSRSCAAATAGDDAARARAGARGVGRRPAAHGDDAGAAGRRARRRDTCSSRRPMGRSARRRRCGRRRCRGGTAGRDGVAPTRARTVVAPAKADGGGASVVALVGAACPIRSWRRDADGDCAAADGFVARLVGRAVGARRGDATAGPGDDDGDDERRASGDGARRGAGANLCRARRRRRRACGGVVAAGRGRGAHRAARPAGRCARDRGVGRAGARGDAGRPAHACAQPGGRGRPRRVTAGRRDDGADARAADGGAAMRSSPMLAPAIERRLRRPRGDRTGAAGARSCSSWSACRRRGRRRRCRCSADRGARPRLPETTARRRRLRRATGARACGADGVRPSAADA